MDSDPMFADSASGNFMLSSASPCINKEDTVSLLSFLPHRDLTGEHRIRDVTIDIGPYELQDGSIEDSWYKNPVGVTGNHVKVSGQNISIVQKRDGGNWLILSNNLPAGRPSV